MTRMRHMPATSDYHNGVTGHQYLLFLNYSWLGFHLDTLYRADAQVSHHKVYKDRKEKQLTTTVILNRRP